MPALLDHVMEDMEMISNEIIDARVELTDGIVSRPTPDTPKDVTTKRHGGSGQVWSLKK